MGATSSWELKRGSYECVILAVSLLSLVNLTLALTRPGTGEILQACDVVLSGILLLDFGFRLLSAPSRRGGRFPLSESDQEPQGLGRGLFR
jgi:hypothetical protein